MWIAGYLPTPVLPSSIRMKAHTLSCSSCFITGQNNHTFLAHLTVHAVCWATSVMSWLFVTLWTQPPGSSGHGILQATVLECIACPPPGDLPDLGIWPAALKSPALAGGFFSTSTTWKALISLISSAFYNLNLVISFIVLCSLLWGFSMLSNIFNTGNERQQNHCKVWEVKKYGSLRSTMKWLPIVSTVY